MVYLIIITAIIITTAGAKNFCPRSGVFRRGVYLMSVKNI